MEAPQGQYYYRRKDNEAMGTTLVLGSRDSPENYYLGSVPEETEKLQTEKSLI